MTVRTSYEPGTPSWVDLMTTDVDAAKTFYGGLFGWDLEDQFDGDTRIYTMASKGGKSTAGMGAMGPGMAESGMPPMWNTYVSVADVDATLAKVTEAGGTVMMPAMDVMDSGRMAVIMDPTGAAVSIWQPNQHIGAEVVNEHGALTWNELSTPDIPTAAAFYEKVFGWEHLTEDMGDMEYTSFRLAGTAPDAPIAGAMNPPAEGIPPHWLTYIAVDDCDAAAKKVAELGGTVHQEPFDVPPGRMAVIGDPQGAVLAIMTLSEQPD